MIDHGDRLKFVVRDHLKKLAFGVPFGFVLTPVIAPVPDASGNPAGLGPAWDLRLTVQTVPLLGNNHDSDSNVYAYIIIPGLMPPDDVFRQFAEKAMNDCLDERTKRNVIPQ